MCSSSFSKLTVGFFSRGPDTAFVLGDADGVDDDEPVLAPASGVTAWKSRRVIVRAPRPFICSKYSAERTSRMKNTHSSGLTSVPVAIMSTVTAMRRVGELRNAASSSSGVAVGGL